MIKVALGVLFNMLKALGSKELIEWVIWKAGETYVKSTKTPDDDEFVKQWKKQYEQQGN